MEKVVAFLDLLAFSSRVRENTSEALQAFTTYRTIVQTAWQDVQQHPVSSYPPALRELAERSGIDSFEHFLPFSDSIFLSSSSPSKFILQLGHFVLNCFRFTAHHYTSPTDSAHPTRVSVPDIRINEQGQVIASAREENLFPTLFRGGLAWGEVIPISLFGLVDHQPVEIANLAGPAVVEAVNLEAHVKGPRIIFSGALLAQLDAGARRYVHPTEITGYHELLWPGFHFTLENRSSAMNDFHSIFIPAANLWRAHNHTAFAEHYFRFLELIVSSTLRVFDSVGMLDNCLPIVREFIERQGLEDKMEALLKEYYTA